MRNVIAISIVPATLAGCAATKREEVRDDHRNVAKQQRELQEAERDGSIRDVRDERGDLREAQKDLRKDQSQLYRPETNGTSATGLQVGQVEPGGLQAVPLAYRTRYPDSESIYYRFDGLQIYQIEIQHRTVVHVYNLDR